MPKTDEVGRAVSSLVQYAERLNQFNNRYKRQCGTLFMASKEMEDELNRLLDQMDDLIHVIKEASDVQIDRFTDGDSAGYRKWVSEVEDAIAINREDSKEARKFLKQYGQ